MLRTGAGCAPRIWLVLKRHVAPRSGTPARASPAPLIRGDEPPGACVGGRRGVAVLFARRKGLGYEAAIALTSGIAMSEDCVSLDKGATPVRTLAACRRVAFGLECCRTVLRARREEF